MCIRDSEGLAQHFHRLAQLLQLLFAQQLARLREHVALLFLDMVFEQLLEHLDPAGELDGRGRRFLDVGQHQRFDGARCV